MKQVLNSAENKKKKWAKPGSFCLFSFFSHEKYSSNTINEKSVDGVLGTRTRAAGWQVQTNPLSYGDTPLRLKS